MALVQLDLTPTATRFGDLIGGGGGGLVAAFDNTTNATVTGSATISGITSSLSAYVGTTLPAAKVIGQAKVYGTNNQGFVGTVNPSTTLGIYGKSGSSPANSTDGTLLGSATFSDTANEAAGRTITITGASAYDRIWVRINHADATGRIVAIVELQLWEVVPTGDLAVTETGSDTAAFDGTVTTALPPITGDLAATETGTDTAAFDADAIVTVNFTPTETGSDTAALTGAVKVAGDVVAVETGSDTVSLTGAIKVNGSLAVTEVGADVAALAGSVSASGALAVTEVGQDQASLSGTVAVSGSLVATEIGTDTASFTGSVAGFATIIANMAAQETGTDTAALSGKVTIASDLAATETGTDTAAFTGKVKVVADFAVSEIGVDTAAFSGIVTARVNLIAFETGVDTAAFDGVTVITGTINALEVGDDTAAFNISIGSAIADLNAVETGADTAHIFITAAKTPPKPRYVLLGGAVSTGGWVSVGGAGYVWTMVTSDFNGAIAILQAKGPDGETPMGVAVLTANGQVPINVADATEMRVQIFGAVHDGFSDLRAFDARDYTTVKPSVTIPAGCETAKQLSTGLMVTIRPSKTDPRIQDEGDPTSDLIGFGDHVIGFPKHPNGKLWILLGGTGSIPYLPRQNIYVNEVWINEVMREGYTIIDVAYDSEVSITEIAQSPAGKATDNCAGDLHREVITGEDVSIFRHITVPNSINHRIPALLAYMVKHELDLPTGYIPFNWPDVYLSGHSQGANNSYYIAKYWGVKYLTLLAGPYDVGDDVPVPLPEGTSIADWFTDGVECLTPTSRMGGFLTTKDKFYIPFTQGLRIIGLTKNVEWFESDKKFYFDPKGKLLSGHAAALKDASLASYRAQASFDRIALLP